MKLPEPLLDPFEANQRAGERDGHRAQRRERDRDAPAGQCGSRAPEQRRAERDIETAAHREEALEPQPGQTQMDGEEHAHDRADRVRRIDRADAHLAATPADEVERDERERGAGAERRR